MTICSAICSLCLFAAIPGMKLREEMIYQLSDSITYQLREVFRIATQLSQEEKLCASKSTFGCCVAPLQWGKQFSAQFSKHIAIFV